MNGDDESKMCADGSIFNLPLVLLHRRSMVIDRLDASSTFDVREFVVEGIDELKTPLGVNAAALYGKRRYK